MPQKPSTWWSRLAERFGKKTNGNSTMADLPPVGDDGLLLDGAELPDVAGEDVEATTERSGNPLVRWSKREQTLNRLQEGYERINGVIEEIQKHLAQQGERTDRICTALEQLARSTTDMSSLSRAHVESLESIAGHIEAGNARLGQVVDSVGEIPKATRVQTEAIHGIRKQLEMAGEQNLVTSQTMEKLSTAISTLGEVNTTQLEALNQMNRKSDDQAERLGKLIARQNKRFIMLFVVTIVLAVAAITAAILGMALR
jgi:methyl-accepting chemotaxis protein